MSFVTCVSCGSTVPDTEFCQGCGKAIKKWCPLCGDWKAATFIKLDVDASDNPPVVLAEWREETTFCPDCGARLQTKSPPPID
jgi:rRNA maturation endonuclease Nob1